ncbi:MAG: hypothetical protein AAGC64_09895 [Bacteroidota bacterium]
MIKRILKFFGWLLLIIVVVGFLAYLIVNEPRPTGTQGDQAEMLADEMLNSLNKKAYDSIEHIEFTFLGLHSFQWNKKANSVIVSWDDHEVYLDLNQKPEDYTMQEFKAYQYFVNDSFWLVAPFKVRDHGVVRSFVNLEEGRGLLVTYTIGGITPGDSYLWIVDDMGLPTAWKLWTSNVPVGGLKFTWDNWIRLQDVSFSTLHRSMILDLDITNLKVD